jgi:hypothetical protein
MATTTTTLQSASDVSNVTNQMNNQINNIDKSKSKLSNDGGLNATPTTNSNMAISYPEPVPSMEKRLSSTQFWINDPLVLFKREEMMDIWPAPLMSIEQKLNAISRIVILLSILGFLITKNVNILFTGAITLAIFVMMYKLQYQEQYDEKNGNSNSGNSNSGNSNSGNSNSGNSNSGNSNSGNNDRKEGFVNSKMYNVLKPNLTTPTVTNPMMNVLLPEIAYNPERNQAAAAYNPKVEKEINHSTEVATVLDFEPKTLTEAEKLRKKLFADLGDKYEFDDSMRSFYTNPSTTIPNDQKAFAEFCYGSMISCKEGNEFACQRFNPVLGSVIN